MHTVAMVQGKQPARVVNKCPRENCCFIDVDTTNYISRWVRVAMFEKKMAQVRTHSALKIHGGESNKVGLVQEHPKISSKATYRNGCGVSTMETILLET